MNVPICVRIRKKRKTKREQKGELKEIARNSSSNSLITENKGLAMAAQLLLLLIEGYYIRVFSFDEVTDQGTEA